MRRPSTLLFLLGVAFAVVLAAVLTTPGATHDGDGAGKMNTEQKVVIQMKDGSTEEVTMSEMSRRMAESERMRQRMEDGTVTETESKTMKLDDINLQKPELGGFIQRGKKTFELAGQAGLVPAGATLAGLGTSNHVALSDMPNNEEYIVLRYRMGKSAPDESVEVHVKYLSSFRIHIAEAWQLGTDEKRLTPIDLAGREIMSAPEQRSTIPAWVQLAVVLAQSYGIGNIIASIGVALATIGLVAAFFSRPPRTRPAVGAASTPQPPAAKARD